MNDGFLPGIWSLAGRSGAAVGCVTRVPKSAGVHLTFDDGPDPETTPRLLDALASRDVSATFFLTGLFAEQRPELARRVHREGHTIGHHGYDHLDAWKTRPARVSDDFQRATEVVEDVIGARVTRMRPPYGRITPHMLFWARARGQTIVLWNVMPGDFLHTRSASEVARFVVRKARPGSIVVLHEGGQAGRTALNALPDIVYGLAERGLPCVPLP